MPESRNSRKVIDFMIASGGEPVTLEKVATGTGLTVAQVSSCLSAFVRRDTGVVRILSGVYAYRPDETGNGSSKSAKSAQPVEASVIGAKFECIGTLRSGELIVREDVTGVIWKLVEL